MWFQEHRLLGESFSQDVAACVSAQLSLRSSTAYIRRFPAIHPLFRPRLTTHEPNGYSPGSPRILSFPDDSRRHRHLRERRRPVVAVVERRPCAPIDIESQRSLTPNIVAR